jgi:hypothetical protein
VGDLPYEDEGLNSSHLGRSPPPPPEAADDGENGAASGLSNGLERGGEETAGGANEEPVSGVGWGDGAISETMNKQGGNLLISTIAPKHCIVTTHRNFKGIQEEGIFLEFKGRQPRSQSCTPSFLNCCHR